MTNKTELQVFENELFEVAVTLEDGVVLFDAEKVARCLGIGYEKSGKYYVRWNRVNEYLTSFATSGETSGKTVKNSPDVAKGSMIPEPMVYKLAFKASNEVAEQFQDWLAMEVIPTIRKTGGYVQEEREEEFVFKYFPSFSEEVKLAMVQDLMKSNKELQVKASGWDKFLNTSSTYTFEETAKLISTKAVDDGKEDFKITTPKLTKFLREQSVLCKDKSGTAYKNLPNKNYEDYFDVISVTVKDKFNKTQTRVKATGVEFIYGKLIEDMIS